MAKTDVDAANKKERLRNLTNCVFGELGRWSR